jgi:hypothetical protein
MKLHRPGTPTVNAPSKTDEDVKIKARCGTPFKYFGVNEAGAEANSAVSSIFILGLLDAHTTFP